MTTQPAAASALALLLRPITPEDEAFLRDVYASTREAELAMVPWDAAMKAAFIQHQFTAQLAHYREKYPTGEHSVILFGDRRVGRLYFNRGEEFHHILDVTILPAFRCHGIGGLLLENLVSEADEKGKTLSVYVETFSPRSQRFFENFGFVAVSESGIHRRLERPAVKP
jgi:ribosomal protein S18 acetylase RimI-like enzyme